VGRSTQSWERAAEAAVKAAVESFADRCLVRRPSESDGRAELYGGGDQTGDLPERGRIDRYQATVKVSS